MASDPGFDFAFDECDALGADAKEGREGALGHAAVEFGPRQRDAARLYRELPLVREMAVLAVEERFEIELPFN